ncbi:hypothetical protein [Arthrobacter nitrophenolicus]|uniref:hypothetical protein n=1 Tax=Arthrobacter nitrophenolicus TaxID=683150 RepID=UPI001F2346AC|nr:hypothetical protein [Arthrobacter nitrophenolicus]
MRYPTLPVLGILSAGALIALTGCQAPAAEQASAVNAPITIATIPLGDDPTQENPIEHSRKSSKPKQDARWRSPTSPTTSASWKRSAVTTWTSAS